MNREQFLHVVRVAAELVDDEIVVIGSQAVLGSTTDPPLNLLRSMEVDVYPKHRLDRADEIDGAIGEGSQFQVTYGYYAQAVGPETLVGPAGWQSRLVRFDLPPMRARDELRTAWSLSLPDLVLAKLAAGREHDVTFALEALRAELVSVDQLRGGVDYVPESHRELVRDRVEGLATRLKRLE